ncbi:MAG: histidinol dehydrogenase, partial [Clostridiales bacterium]|nr:histidinol dehydrogenase [Clostridiales bacterium]
LEVSNMLAPEHLEICVDKPFDYLDLVENAGSVFLSHFCPEPVGDYFCGANHTLPTGGTARFASPLSVDDFVKKSSLICCSRAELERVSEQVMLLARQEGLDAHANAVAIRFGKEIKD